MNFQHWALLLIFNLEKNLSLLQSVNHVRLNIDQPESSIINANLIAAHHGSFDDMVPLILNGDVIRPYRNIELRASLPAGTFSINPGHVMVQPVPLRVSVIAKFTICAEYFTRYTHCISIDHV